MKILSVVSAIDLSLRQAVPSWWQLFKGLYELEADLVVTPYVGRSVESLWWRSYKNPCETESKIVNKIVRFRKNVEVCQNRSRMAKGIMDTLIVD